MLYVKGMSWREVEAALVEALGYLFLEGIYLRLRPEDKKAIAVLGADGIVADGRNLLRHLEIGDQESTACWEAFLEDMRQGGLKTPLLTVIDGHTGCRRAVKSKLPDSLVQRCPAHKRGNILHKLPPR